MNSKFRKICSVVLLGMGMILSERFYLSEAKAGKGKLQGGQPPVSTQNLLDESDNNDGLNSNPLESILGRFERLSYNSGCCCESEKSYYYDRIIALLDENLPDCIHNIIKDSNSRNNFIRNPQVLLHPLSEVVDSGIRRCYNYKESVGLPISLNDRRRVIMADKLSFQLNELQRLLTNTVDRLTQTDYPISDLDWQRFCSDLDNRIYNFNNNVTATTKFGIFIS